MTLNVNIFSIPRQANLKEEDVRDISYLDTVVDEYFNVSQYENPVESTLTHSFYEFDTYSPIAKEISKAIFDLNSSKDD